MKHSVLHVVYLHCQVRGLPPATGKHVARYNLSQVDQPATQLAPIRPAQVEGDLNILAEQNSVLSP